MSSTPTTLLLLRTDADQVTRLKPSLDRFANAAGLHINYHKSTFVPICVGDVEAGALVVIMGCPISSCPNTYLGCRCPPLRSRHPCSTPLQSKWNGRFLDNAPPSSAKRASSCSSSQCSPCKQTFAMSVLPFPLAALAKIDRLGKGSSGPGSQVWPWCVPSTTRETRIHPSAISTGRYFSCY